MKDRSVVLCRTALAGLMVGFFAAPAPAHAGFEWTPPPAAPVVSNSVQGGPPVSAAPAPAVDSMELMPVPGMEAEALAVPVIDEAPKPLIEKETNTLPPAPAETLAAPMPSGPFATVEGFGADIPLALAMGQIVPAEFAYSFASNVNPGVKISWDGGKPWNEVLSEALAPQGLHAEITGTVVVVRSGALSSAAPEAVTPEPAAMAAAPLVPEGNVMVPRPPADMAAAPAPVAESATVAPGMRGEGTSDNYPRRTPHKKNFLNSIFTSDDDKGNMAPRPPQEQGVLIENEVSPAAQVASVAPAAPAVVAPMPAAADGPIPLNAQKISYAHETMETSAVIDRPVAQNASVGSAKGPILDPFAVKFWQADSNRNLRDVLDEWSQVAGVEMIWDTGYDYKLPTAISMHGTFPDAVTKVFALYGKAEPRPQGKLHPNLPKGPSVLLVENYP